MSQRKTIDLFVEYKGGLDGTLDERIERICRAEAHSGGCEMMGERTRDLSFRVKKTEWKRIRNSLGRINGLKITRQ